MPVNFQQIQQQIRELGQKAPQRQAELQNRLQQARQLLKSYAGREEELAQRVTQALEKNPGLRCAIPTHEGLLQRFPLPQTTLPQALLAADGSQVNPDRHDAFEFGVVNVGVFRLCPGQAQAPQEIVRSHLLYFEDLEQPDGPLTEEIVALMRDLNERRVLAELAAGEAPPVVTLTDGPLELFREPKDRPQFQRLFQDYLDELHKLAALGAVTAGYVDRPRSDLVVRLLELTVLPDDRLEQAGQVRLLPGIVDTGLYENQLQPGERSPVFAIQSPSARRFEGVLALHFFYLNVGRPRQPYLTRVEIPAWVATNPPLLQLLHAVLVAQCQQIGNRPYPYAIHRAHEVAVVSRMEKEHLQNMIAVELLRQGVNPGELSNKQLHKNQLGSRTRYKR